MLGDGIVVARFPDHPGIYFGVTPREKLLPGHFDDCNRFFQTYKSCLYTIYTASLRTFPVNTVTVPIWNLVVGFALPTIWLWRRSRIARGSGRCEKCGYDLTGNVTGVCPECGVPKGA